MYGTLHGGDLRVVIYLHHAEFMWCLRRVASTRLRWLRMSDKESFLKREGSWRGMCGLPVEACAPQLLDQLEVLVLGDLDWRGGWLCQDCALRGVCHLLVFYDLSHMMFDF